MLDSLDCEPLRQFSDCLHCPTCGNILIMLSPQPSTRRAPQRRPRVARVIGFRPQPLQQRREARVTFSAICATCRRVILELRE
jgi:hypothetical protein